MENWYFDRMPRIRRYYIQQFGTAANRRQSLSDERDKILLSCGCPLCLGSSTICRGMFFVWLPFGKANHLRPRILFTTACTRIATDESASNGLSIAFHLPHCWELLWCCSVFSVIGFGLTLIWIEKRGNIEFRIISLKIVTEFPWPFKSFESLRRHW